MPINEEAPEKNELDNDQNHPSKNDDFQFKRLRFTSEDSKLRKASAELSLLDIGRQALNWDKNSKSGGNNSFVDDGVAASNSSKDEFSRANSHKVTHGAKFVFFIMSVLAIAQMM